MRTVKFPLDVELGADLLDPSALLYHVLDGSGEGSLLRFLVFAHLSGLRLFESVARARSWRQRDAFGIEAFRTALSAALGEDLPGLDPQQIDLFLSSPARRRGPFVPRELSGRLAVRLAVAERSGPPSERMRFVCDRIAEALCQTFSDWSAMYADPSAAKQCIDEALAAIAPGLPSVNVVLPPGGGLDAPVGFDPSLALPAPWPDDDAVGLRIVLARGLREARLQGRDSATGGAIGFAQDYLLTRSENALSWLFNRGWIFLREIDPEALAARLGAPATAVPGLSRLIEAARALPAVPPLLAVRDYAAFRRRVGWRLRTWASQDLRRQSALRERVAAELRTMSVLVSKESGGSEMHAALLARQRLLLDLERLCLLFLGGAPQDPSVHDAGALEGTLLSLDALDDALRQQAGNVGSRRSPQRRGDASGAGASLDTLLGGERWPSLPGMPELARHPQEATQRLSDRMGALFQLQAGMLDQAMGSARGGHVVWLRTREKLESRRVPPGTASGLLQAQAIRRALQQLLELARALPEPLRVIVQSVFREQGVVTVPRVLNRLFVNRSGRLFAPLGSALQPRPVRLDERVAASFDWPGLLASLERLAAERVTQTGLVRDLEALVAVRGLRLQWLLDACPEDLDPPASALRQLAAAAGMPSALTAGLAGRPGRGWVARVTWREAARWVADELQAALLPVAQPFMTLRHSFSRMRGTTLLYVPKERPWHVPARYRGASGPIGVAAREGFLGRTPGTGPAVPREAGDSAPAVQPAACVEQLLSRPAVDLPAASALRQIPHDWYLAIGLVATQGSVRSGVPLEGCPLQATGVSIESLPGVARLMGPGTRKAPLDRMLVDPQISLGDATLILEWRFRQTLRADVVRNRLVLERTLVSGRAWASLPFSDTGRAAEPVRLVDRLIAIDLGAQGFSWAVFDIRAHYERNGRGEAGTGPAGLVASGSERVLSMRALGRAVARAGALSSVRLRRGVHQRVERLQAHAVADSCRRIEQLCERYEAFPVLESLRAAFERGATPVTVAYAAVVRRYAYSPIASHIRERSEHWFGAEQWTHPYLRNLPAEAVQPRARSAKGAGRRTRPLHLFPGASVDPAGTSQQCPICRRNPIAALRALRAAGAARESDGAEVPVGDGLLRLADLPAQQFGDVQQRPRGRREPVPPATDRDQSGALVARAKRLLRQAAPGRDGRNRYQCLYVDCGARGDADEFAAINVALKFLSERVILAEGSPPSREPECIEIQDTKSDVDSVGFPP